MGGRAWRRERGQAGGAGARNGVSTMRSDVEDWSQVWAKEIGTRKGGREMGSRGSPIGSCEEAKDGYALSGREGGMKAWKNESSWGSDVSLRALFSKRPCRI